MTQSEQAKEPAMTTPPPEPMSGTVGEKPKWVVERGGDGRTTKFWWYLIREGQPYSEGHLGDPFGNFISEVWAQQTADRVNDLESALATAREGLEKARHELAVAAIHSNPNIVMEHGAKAEAILVDTLASLDRSLTRPPTSRQEG